MLMERYSTAENNRQPTAVFFEDEEVQWRAAQVSKETVLAIQALISENILCLLEKLSTCVARLRRKVLLLSIPETLFKDLETFVKKKGGKEEKSGKNVSR